MPNDSPLNCGIYNIHGNVIGGISETETTIVIKIDKAVLPTDEVFLLRDVKSAVKAMFPNTHVTING